MKIFIGYSTELPSKHIQIIGHITLETTYGEGIYVRAINISYLIADSLSPYDIILGGSNFNALGEIVSIPNLILKYSFLDGRVGTIRGDQQAARKCYLISLENQIRASPCSCSPF